MIKNLAGVGWDMNDKAILLLCRQGKQLEELACNMSVRAVVCPPPCTMHPACMLLTIKQHCLMQHMDGLAALRALHIIHLRNDDTCVWVMRETKRFLIDNVSHFPELKLEWIAIDEDDRADRLIRVSGSGGGGGGDDDGSSSASDSDSEGGGGSKGKGKQPSTAAAVPYGAPGSSSAGLELASAASVEEVDIPALITAVLGEDGAASSSSGSDAGGLDSDDSEDEDEMVGRKIEIVEGIPFCDVEGVRIFKKEVVAGRL
jgi:hypothetical protein